MGERICQYWYIRDRQTLADCIGKAIYQSGLNLNTTLYYDVILCLWYWKAETSKTPPFLGCVLLLLPGVDGLTSVLEEASVLVGVSVSGLQSVFGERSVMAESSEVRGSFPGDLSPFWMDWDSVGRGRAARQKEINYWWVDIIKNLIDVLIN